MYRYVAEIVQHELKLGSDHTTTDWFNFAREVCSEILENDCDRRVRQWRKTNLSLVKENTTEDKGLKEFGCIEKKSQRSFFRIVEDKSAETLILIRPSLINSLFAVTRPMVLGLGRSVGFFFFFFLTELKDNIFV